MVLVIYNPNINYSLGTQSFDDRYLVLRFTEPATVIVEPHRRIQLPSGFRNAPNSRGFPFDARGLLGFIVGRFAAPHDPQLHSGQPVPFQHLED